MSQVIIDLAAKRKGASSSGPLEHPAGVALPFDSPSDAALIIPEIRSDIRSGAYSADILHLLDGAVHAGDRVLVIGAGLGVTSTLIARHEGVERVIAVEANTALIPYLDRVHEQNNVTQIETLNAVLAEGKKGRVPFFARRDLRNSSLFPHDRSWQQVMMVPFMELNLILTEEQISLIVCDIPIASAQLLARAELESVERILVDCGEDTDLAWDAEGVCAQLSARGYASEIHGTAVLFRREGIGRDAEGKRRQEVQAGPDIPVPAATMAAETALPQGGSAESGGAESVDAVSGETEDFEADADIDAEGVSQTRARSDARAEAAQRDEAAQHEQRGVGRGQAPPSRRDDAQDGPSGGRGGKRRRGGKRGGQADPGEKRPRQEHQRQDEAQSEPGPPERELRPARGRSGEAGGSRASRLWGLVVLSLFLALPLMLVGKIAVDRSGHRATVASEIGAAWGGAQTLTGPFLVIPVETTQRTQRPGADGTIETRTTSSRAAPLVLLPDVLEIESELTTDVRQRGVFDVPVYRSRHEIWLDIDPDRIARASIAGARGATLLAEGEVALWDQATLGIGITEPTALRGTPVLNRGDGLVGFEPGAFGPRVGVERMPGVHAPIGDPRGNAGGWRFILELNGSQQFEITPAGGITEVRVHSDWPHPSFAGRFLPTRREISDTGFSAEWSIPQLAHSVPQAFRGGRGLSELQAAAFGAEMFQPVDLYHRAQRAAKYGLLFIALTFGALFLMEKSAARPPHVMQYALIGAAQCVFFMLLLSLAEQTGFGIAYLLASGATIALLSAYSWLALGLGARSGWLTVALGVLYGVMYLVLSAEEQALLMGSVLAFLAVAAVMWGTRNEDWGATFGGTRPRPGRHEHND